MDLNYLTLLKPSVFKHLFKFTRVDTLHNVQKALDISHNHGTPKQDCEDDIVWECAQFSTHHRKDADGYSVGFFTEDQQRDMESFKGHIKYLLILTRQCMLDNYAYNFLVQHFIEDNASLESLEVYVSDEFEYREFRNPITGTLFSQRPSWPMFMAKMKKQKKLTANLFVNFIADGAKSLAEYCELYDLPKADPFCQYLVELCLDDLFPGDKILSEKKPELTENPSSFFVEKLPALQILHINAYNLSDSLLHVLAQRAHSGIASPLKNLNIIACQRFERSRLHDQLPEIKNSSWEGLVNTCPNLEVNLRISLGNYSEKFKAFENVGIYRNVAKLITENNTAVCVPIQNGHGSPERTLTVHNDRYDEGGIATCHFTDPPSTAGETMLSLLKKSAPLVGLHLGKIEAVDFIDIMLRQCPTFYRTLKIVCVSNLIGDVHEVYFKKFISSPFTMRKVVTVNPGRIEIF